MDWFVILTLVSLNGQVITTEHYAQPYATLDECMLRGNLTAGQKQVQPVCANKRPEAMNMWIAACTREEPR